MLSRAGAEGTLCVRCSHEMRVEQVVGGASRFDQQLDAADGDADGEAGVCFLGAMHPATSLSLTLDMSSVSEAYTRSARAHPGVVQAALRYTRPDGKQRLRIFVAKASFASSTGEWLRSVDIDATALLAARIATLHASAREKDERDEDGLASRADELAAAWARRYAAPRTAVREGWLWNSTSTIGYNASSVPNLSALLRRLHRLRASPAACDADANADAAHAARLLLLTAPAALATRIATPPLPRIASQQMSPIGALRPPGTPRKVNPTGAPPASRFDLENHEASGEDDDEAKAKEGGAASTLAALMELTLAERRRHGGHSAGMGGGGLQAELSLSAWCEAIGSVVLDG